ncbi:MAG: helix-turn-helix transcriptional regulator [Alphaproteobacteria bacterium]|nr:helix-turn-helix transcriptional regulator [Alphaproteobacteria bacterium]
MNKIKEKRLELGLSQSELGKIIGCSQQHVQRLENDDNISIDMVFNISKKLSIPVWDILPDRYYEEFYINKKINTLKEDEIIISLEKLKDIIYTTAIIIDKNISKNKKDISNEKRALLLAQICPKALNFNTSDLDERKERINDLADVLIDTVGF